MVFALVSNQSHIFVAKYVYQADSRRARQSAPSHRAAPQWQTLRAATRGEARWEGHVTWLKMTPLQDVG